MRLLRRNLGNILITLCELLAGIMLLISPERSTRAFVIIVGIVLLIFGIYNAVMHLRVPPFEASHNYRMAWGMMLAAGGLFCIFDSTWFMNAFPAETIIIGVALIVIVFVKIQWTVDMLRIRDTKWYLALIGVALALIVAVILFLNPTSDSRALWIITGIVLIISAVLDVVTLMFRTVRQQEVAEEYKGEIHEKRHRKKAAVSDDNEENEENEPSEDDEDSFEEYQGAPVSDETDDDDITPEDTEDDDEENLD